MTKRRRIVFLFVGLMLFVIQDGIGAEINVVIPQGFADAEGDVFVGSDILPGFRFQQLAPSSWFGELPESHRAITRLAFRPSMEVTEPLTVNFDNVLIRLSTTDRQPNELSLTFAENVGADETVVFDSPITLSTAAQFPGGSPLGSFDYVVDLSEPFVYDPSLGNLLIDMLSAGSDGTPMSDFVFAFPGGAIHEIGGAPNADAAVNTFGGGNVIQLTFVPEPSTWLLAFFAIVALLAAPRTRQARSMLSQGQTNT